MTNIINLDTNDVVAEVDNSSITVYNGEFEDVYEQNKEVPYVFPSKDGEGVDSIMVNEGDKGFPRMFIENLPESYDIEDLDKLDDLPFPDIDDDDGDDKSKSGFLFEKEEWVPYVGPKGGTGWVNEDGEVDYGDEPPGELDLSQFSDEEVEQLREAFEQDGRDLDQYIEDDSEDNISKPSIDDVEVGDTVFLDNKYTSPTAYEVKDIIENDDPIDDRVVVEDDYGEESSYSNSEFQDKALPAGDMPEDSEVPEWAKEGTPLELVREKADGETSIIEANIKNVDGNILELRQGVTYTPEMLIYMNDEILAPFDKASEATDYYSPEHGDLQYTGEDDGYREYIFETEDGEEVIVNPDEEDLYEKPVEDVSLKKEPDFVGVEERLDNERAEVFKDTVSSVIDAHDTAVDEVSVEDNLEIDGRDSVASFNYKIAMVEVSQKSTDPEHLEKYAVKLEEDGWLAGGDIEHVGAHEVFHSVHHHATEGEFEQSFQSQDEKDIAKQVSEYAAYTPSEFVAEYGALLVRGINVEDRVDDVEEVNELFEQYANMSPDEVNQI